MKQSLDGALAEAAGMLDEKLGENLYSCCVYGSAVRGNAIDGVSDINLLLVLERSDASAHRVIAEILEKQPKIEPFIVGRRALQRTARCFATKFASIQRNYRVLHGKDPFTGIAIDSTFERLLCEQGVRNLRLRLSYAFVMHGRQRNYGRFLTESISALFVQLSDVLRLSGHEIPKDFEARIAPMTQAWGADAGILKDLLDLRERPRSLAERELETWHERVLMLLDAALAWMEKNWPEHGPGPA